jgi:hypothetical protein
VVAGVVDGFDANGSPLLSFNEFLLEHGTAETARPQSARL